MKLGGWVPLDKELLHFIPRTRVWSEIEAAFSLAVDYDNGEPVTISGYASLWGWNRKKVKRFIDKLGIEISYPNDTRKKQNQKGQIEYQIKDRSRDRKGTEKRQIRFIDSKWIDRKRNRKGTEKGQIEYQIKDRSRDATLNPIPSIPNPKSQNESPKPPLSSDAQQAFSDCRNFLGMSDEEIRNIFSTCHDHKKFREAIRFAVEKNSENLLDNPSGFIRYAYREGKTSKETRQAVADNNQDADISEQARITLEQCEKTERNQRSDAYVAGDPCSEDEIPF